MDATTLTHAMEPFFTTKPQGKGTGLGLATARGFAEQSGGALAIESAPGLGTAVSRGFPSPTRMHRTYRAMRAMPPVTIRSTSCLWMTMPWREELASELADRGFEVMQAENPQHALDLVVADRTIDLLISDQAMPGTDGLTLIRMVRERRPGLPAICSPAMPMKPPRWWPAGSLDRSPCCTSRSLGPNWRIGRRSWWKRRAQRMRAQ